MSTQRSCRLLSPGSLLPKILIYLLAIGVFFQLRWSSYTPVVRTHFAEPLQTSLIDDPGKHWFKNGKKLDQIDVVGITQSHGLADDATALLKTAIPTAGKSNMVDYKKIFISHGASKCFPDFGDKMKDAAVERNRTCTMYAPFTSEETRRVAFATSSTGTAAKAYLGAVQSQMFASAVKGTPIHILCEQLSDGTWNKIAYLLNLVMNEMLKPAHERLEWVMWIDRDVIVLDPCRPLSSFLPPNTTEFEDVNLIFNNDAFGLNNGVFIFKVGDWAIDLFNTILAFRYYRPDVELQHDEQSGMEKIINEEKWKKSIVRVPWYWFNAYPDEEESVEKYRDGLEPENLEWFRARKGDYLVHFAGDNGRSGRMQDWLDMLQKVGNVYEKSEQQRDITNEVAKYWSDWRDNSLVEKQITGEKWKEENVHSKENKDD